MWTPLFSPPSAGETPAGDRDNHCKCTLKVQLYQRCADGSQPRHTPGLCHTSIASGFWWGHLMMRNTHSASAEVTSMFQGLFAPKGDRRAKTRKTKSCGTCITQELKQHLSVKPQTTAKVPWHPKGDVSHTLGSCRNCSKRQTSGEP